MKYIPHDYQQHGYEFILENPFCALFYQMGMGKTCVSLTAANTFLYKYFNVNKVLVIAPKKVVDFVWQEEAEKWDHLKHLKIIKVVGSSTDRIKRLNEPGDIYLIGRDNIAWLVKHYQSKWPFDLVIIDELSSFKNPNTVRFRSLRMVRPKMKRVIALTGTPAPNGLIDLWSQLYLIDQGERLGKSVTQYREAFFTTKNMVNGIRYNYMLRPGAEEEIHKRIGDICVSLKAADYLDMPETVYNFIKVDLEEDKKAYNKFERDQVLLLLNEVEITALSAAALTNKLLQFSNGAIYDSERDWHKVHDHKLNALQDLIDEAQGNPVMVFYSFVHDLERIKKRFKQAKMLVTKQDETDWNQGKIELLVAHPASVGYGLNLQYGGHTIVWFGLTWSLELYGQAIARLVRQNQKHTVVVNHLVGYGTMDEDVVKAIQRKAKTQDALMDAVKARIDRVLKETKVIDINTKKPIKSIIRQKSGKGFIINVK